MGVARPERPGRVMVIVFPQLPLASRAGPFELSWAKRVEAKFPVEDGDDKTTRIVAETTPAVGSREAIEVARCKIKKVHLSSLSRFIKSWEYESGIMANENETEWGMPSYRCRRAQCYTLRQLSRKMRASGYCAINFSGNILVLV